MVATSPAEDTVPPGGHEPTERIVSFAPPPATVLDAELPQFDVLNLLGQGGMGAVYQARQRTLNRLVAIKILPEVDGDPRFAARFTREAHALARLSHPHIVTVHDAGQTESGMYYLVMEYVDGTDLRKLMHTGLMSPQKALAIVPEICDALIYAHRKGIVHRDIKPENILLDREGRVKIADFGLAKLMASPHATDELTATRQVLGTPYYMAPEQARAGSPIDHRADIYALGVVFYEMLTGELPRGHFPPPSQRAAIDHRLDPIVMRSMASDPDHRYQQVGDLKTDVKRITDTATPPPPSEPADLSGGRLSKMAVAGAVWGLPFLVSQSPGVYRFDFGVLGLTSPVGATVLGILALRAIRRSDGQLQGVPLAVAAACVVPLAILNGIVWGIVGLLGFHHLPMVAQIWLLPMALLDVWVVFRLSDRWRRPRATE